MNPEQQAEIGKSAAKGEARKVNGMSVAASSKTRQILETKIAFLDAIEKSFDHTATADDAVDSLGTKFKDGGKWRGQAFRELALDGVIVRRDVELSNRAARHRGYLARWFAPDLMVVSQRKEALRKYLASLPPDDDGVAPVGAALPTSPVTPNETGAVVAATTPAMEAN